MRIATGTRRAEAVSCGSLISDMGCNQLSLVAVEVSYTVATLDHTPIKSDMKLCLCHVLAFAITICS